jgi:predicted choloylglycine hydrolase
MESNKHLRRQRWLWRIFILLTVIFVLIAVYMMKTWVGPPKPADMSPLGWQVQEVDTLFSICGNNWLRHSPSGLWELYIEGKPFERGVAGGKLTKQLIFLQEQAFVNRIRELIASSFYLRFLKYFIYWFNRDLDQYIPNEFKEEIFGISMSASPEFRFIGSNYQRMLNYHSAHDIGHALQDLSLIGCTSFGAWSSKTGHSGLIIGRNFDFYMGDAFAENKIIEFIRPTEGYPFMMVTWGGMSGVVSGMNLQGLTITINAAKSKIPWSARTPISILAREILQYASNIKEAYDIASLRQTFVSESLLIGSSRDGKAVILEKSPSRLACVESNTHFIICANHFQSPEFANDPLNRENIRDNASLYRSKRLLQDIARFTTIGPEEATWILRDRKGLNEKDIGLGNEKAMNQLIAHHSIIFQPDSLLVWVSTHPWQSGIYVCYDLYKIFHTFARMKHRQEISDTNRSIPADVFLFSDDYDRFLRFRQMKDTLVNLVEQKEKLQNEDSFMGSFIRTNPESYEVYSLAGDYYLNQDDTRKASGYYRKALQKEIPRWSEKEKIIHQLVTSMEMRKKRNE